MITNVDNMKSEIGESSLDLYAFMILTSDFAIK